MNNIIKNIAANPRTAALISLLLALPLTAILSIAVFEIEPMQGFLKYMLTEADSPRNSTFGIILLLGSVLLLPVGLVFNMVPIVRNVRAGNSIITRPINLLLAVTLFLFIATLVGSFALDQYPCWMGVPNCD
jgi:hypothetical protein